MAPSQWLSFRQLKQCVSIEQALDAGGLLDGLRRKGHRLSGPCPLHGGDNPAAFQVDCKRNIRRCFTRCQGGGDLIELARRLSDGTWRGASVWLNHLPGRISPVNARRLPDDGAPQQKPLFQPFRKRITLAPDCRLLTQKGILTQTARCFDAGEYHGHGFLAGCVAVRLHDPAGQPLGYAGRRLDHTDISMQGKWKFPAAFPKSRTLFNYHRACGFTHKGLIIVEGPWDVIKLHQAGFPNAVALMGTAAATSQIALISTAPSILVMMDGDPTGEQAALKLSAQLATLPGVHLAKLPHGRDPADLAERELHLLCALNNFFSYNQ